MAAYKPSGYLDLCMAMKTRAIVDVGNAIGKIKSIEDEDGSGHNWAVLIQPWGNMGDGLKEPQKVYFRD